jgi:hypothetical protein
MSTGSYLQWLKNSASDITPNQELSIVEFHPSLAKAIAHCYYIIWNDAFPAKFMYEPESIIEYYTKKGQFGAFAITPNDEVVGMFCAYPFHTCNHVYEMGGLMVIPQYRGKVDLPLLIGNVRDQLTNISLNINLCQIVCHYTRAQEVLSENLNQIICGIELEAFNYNNESKRLSTAYVDAVEVLNQESRELYLPQEYERILRNIYSTFGLTRVFLTEAKPGLNDLTPDTCIEKFKYDNVLKLQVKQIGADFMEVVQRIENESTDVEVFQIAISLEGYEALVSTSELNKRGYFFCSLIPLYDGRDCLVLQRVDKKGKDIFENIYLHLSSSQKLLDYIKKDHERVQNLNY